MKITNPPQIRSLRQLAILIREDFVVSTPANFTATNGTGSAFAITVASNFDLGGNPGWAVASAGTTTTGRSALSSFGNAPLLLGFGAVHVENLVKIPNLSDGTETFTLIVGLNDNPAGDATDGVYFRYTHSVNSGKWQAVTRSNSVETAADTGVTVAINTNYRMTIEINAAGTSAEFSINGVVVATIAATIPTGAGRQTNVMTGILKSAGVTNRDLLIDYSECWISLSTAR